MKRFLLVSVVLLAGCCLNKEYVKADKNTWIAFRPVIEAGIAAQPKDDRDAFELLDSSWKIRWEKGEEYVDGQD